eukprot:TRINITY_DN16462_c0_g1_i1.p1 TRINITY_DN16462_c0_g1~~TRINITY_DN16462_c0_g1_i1.p1  ORF type:complete len:553 (-),score=45.60 TRINITY_DN16462_c0_g1_i1:44-1702(-)
MESDPILGSKRKALVWRESGSVTPRFGARPPRGWFQELTCAYGEKVLILVFGTQHLLKGFVHSMTSPSTTFLLASYGVVGPQLQVYAGITMLPWMLKPVLGLLSDFCPIYGFYKTPYMIGAVVAGVASLLILGLSSEPQLPLAGLVVCLLLKNVMISATDLLTEAKCAEVISMRPERGPDLVAFIWGGIEVAGIIALIIARPVMQNFGPRSPLIVAAFPAMLVLWPLLRECLQETPRIPEEVVRFRQVLINENGEVLLLSGLVVAASLTLTVVSAVSEDAYWCFLASIVVLCMLPAALFVFLRPAIAKVSMFHLIQVSLNISINGATFYFYTDLPYQYPQGPHFSIQFYTDVLGVVGSCCSLVGLVFYRKFLADWSFRSILCLSNVMIVLLSLFDQVIFTRANVRLGIPDTVFALGSAASVTAISNWQWMPTVVLLSQLCPRGLEATMFALLASCHNIGVAISQHFGAYLLHQLSVEPDGSAFEGDQFKNLWKASLVSTFLPLASIWLIPRLIPCAKQNEGVMTEELESATTGSLWRQLFRKTWRRCAPERV